MCRNYMQHCPGKAKRVCLACALATLSWDFQRYTVRMLQCYHCAFQCLYHRKHNIIKVAVI
ncbi:hypothetical protein I79_013944 [Cricetulus griseus]|uniref:Uncharacterized protein n=1 Tax=Cricetulus griseus TaxID=10029 RepID=G3HSU6_CRIGR|nr:hypothetical protein I79_013944 [Cricetulus griseus]